MSVNSCCSDPSDVAGQSLVILEDEDASKFPVKMDGWLRKRSEGKLRKQTSWNDRYFVLRGNRLEAFLRRADLKPKNMYVLTPDCAVSEIYLSEKKRTAVTSAGDEFEIEYTKKTFKGDKEILYCCKVTWFKGSGKLEKVDEEDSSKVQHPDLTLPHPTTTDSDDHCPSTPQNGVPYRPSNTDYQTPVHFANESTAKKKSTMRKKKRTQSLPQPSYDTLNYTTPQRSSVPNAALPSLEPGDENQAQNGEPVPNDAIVQTRGISKHYTQRLKVQNALDNRHSDLLMRQIYLATKFEQQKKNKKLIIKGSKYAAVAGAAITAGVLTAGIGMGIAMVFIGVTAAAGGGGAVAEASYRRKKKSKTLILASKNLDDIKEWRDVLLQCIIDMNDPNSEDDTINGVGNSSSTWAKMFVRDGRNLASATMVGGAGDSVVNKILTVPKHITNNGDPLGYRSNHTDRTKKDSSHSIQGLADALESGSQPSTTWRPLEGGWATLLGTGAHGLRMFREEIPFSPEVSNKLFRRSNMRVEGNHGLPLKAHIILHSNPLETFMCLMSHCRSDSDFTADKNSKNRNEASNYSPRTLPFMPNSGQRASFRVIETLDDHMDIIHLYFRPMYLFPSWTAPRDFVLFRYWRFEEDGSYMVFYDSIQHRECPPVPGYTRGELHCIYTIAPLKQSRKRVNTSGLEAQECMLTQVVQVDPKGWIPTYPIFPFTDQCYGEAFSVSALMQMLDVRDALDHDRFVSVSMGRKTPAWKDAATRFASGRKNDFAHSSFTKDTELLQMNETPDSVRRPSSGSSSLGIDDFNSIPIVDSEDLEFDAFNHYDSRFSVSEIRPESPSHVNEESKLIFSDPTPLVTKMWAEPDANSFRVRSRNYKSDKKKVNAGEPMMRLIAVETIESNATMYSGFCAHPKERVQKALARERKAQAKGLRCDAPPFIFCVTIALAGPPYLHMVFYYSCDDINKVNGNDGSPSSKLFNLFMNSDDNFRKNTFKLIPSIVEGNFIVRKAVGCTPCIMGKAIRQLVIKGDRFLEVILDTGSSSVAAGVIKLCYGYAKTLVVDLAFLFEGNDETVLPEKVIGCVRLKNVDFKCRRFVHTDFDE